MKDHPSTILTCWAVVTYQRSSSSSYYLEFKEAWSRSWNAAKYTREYEYPWKRFWLSTWSTRSWWIIQLFKRFGNTISNRWWCRGFWEKKELRKVGAKNHCNQYIYLAFQQERGEKVQTTNKPALGVWTCTQVAWQFRVISPRRCICKNPWPNGILKLDRQAGVCGKAKNLALVLQWNKRSKQPARWRTSSIQNQLREKFSDYEELDLMMARSCREIEELKRCCNQDETYLKTTKIGNISCAAWSGITNSESSFYEQEEKAAPSIRRSGTQQHPTGATETATLLELTFLLFFQTKMSYIFLGSIYLPKKREVRHHHAKKKDGRNHHHSPRVEGGKHHTSNGERERAVPAQRRS